MMWYGTYQILGFGHEKEHSEEANDQSNVHLLEVRHQ